MRVDTDGWYRAGDAEETQLSAYLAGSAEIPPYPRTLGRLWTVLELLPSLALQGRLPMVAEEVCAVLGRDASLSLLQLGESGKSRAQTVQAVVRSGLAWAATRAPATEAVASLWRRQPVLGALVGADLLPRVPADASGELADLLDAALDAAGEPMVELLQGRPDPWAQSGRFDRTVDHLDLLPPEAAAMTLAASNLVPVGLLHVDGRAHAAMRLFLSRRDERLSYLTRFSQRYLSELRLLIDRAGIAAVSDALGAREHPDGRVGWRQLPAISLGLAIVARLAARGDGAAAGWLTGAQRSWTDLAMVAPDLVAVDLVLAEALLAGHERVALYGAAL